jgi:hypothetical protein
MNRLPIALLYALALGVARAADAPAADPPANGIMVLRGQWNFLNSSVAFCVAKVPAMKAEFDAAHDHAEYEMRRADDTIQQAAANHKAFYQPYFDSYTGGWIKYARTLQQSFERQDPTQACPSLLSSWQDTDADQILEDWRGYVERNGITPPPDEPVPLVGHGAQLP